MPTDHVGLAALTGCYPINQQHARQEPLLPLCGQETFTLAMGCVLPTFRTRYLFLHLLHGEGPDLQAEFHL